MKYIGYLMLTGFFVGLFVWIAVEDGLRIALISFGATIGTLAWVAASLFMICRGK